MARRPILSRPLDLLYFIFFVTHIPATLFVDVQGLIPRDWVPGPLRSFITWYLHASADPLIAGAFGLNGPLERWTWFRSFLVLELVFLLPTFVIGARALWKDSRKYYPLLLIYATTASVTTLPCLTTVLAAPLSPMPIPTSLLSPFSPHLPMASETPMGAIGTGTGMEMTDTLSITASQRTFLLQCYVPYLVIPLGMCIDMAIRVSKGQQRALEAEEKKDQ